MIFYGGPRPVIVVLPIILKLPNWFPINLSESRLHLKPRRCNAMHNIDRYLKYISFELVTMKFPKGNVPLNSERLLILNCNQGQGSLTAS